MSPRAYKSDERQAAVQVTRGRIVAAARELLSAPDGIASFTLDAVARQAGVARMTVYYQFGSRTGLLEALYDSLGQTSLVPRLQSVFVESDPVAALTRLIDAFSGFWSDELLITRRLRALARLDSEVEAGIGRRDAWRRAHLHNAIEKAAAADPRIASAIETPETEDVVYSLTSFEFFDVMAGQTDPSTASRLVRELVVSRLGVSG